MWDASVCRSPGSAIYCCVTLGKCLNASELQAPQLPDGDKNISLGVFMETKSSNSCQGLRAVCGIY